MGQTTGHTKSEQQQNQQEEKDTSEQQQQQQQQQPMHHKDYAKINSILECSQLAVCLYMDIPGPVPNAAPLHGYTGTGPDIGNGGLSPECGARVSLWNAVINYGPWADKQR
jgi:membrane protease subunit (stomatin/prohibitin family)